MENQKIVKKIDSSDKTEKNGGWNNSKFTGLFPLPSAMASNLVSPTGNAPGKCNHWGLLCVAEKTSVVGAPKSNIFL